MTRNEAIIAKTQDETRARRIQIISQTENANMATRAMSFLESYRDACEYFEDSYGVNLVRFAIHTLHETVSAHSEETKRLRAEIDSLTETLKSLGAAPSSREYPYPLPELETIR